LNEENAWVFAPAYDLTFSYGPAGEQSTMVMGEGKNPDAGDLQALGKKHGLKRAPEILKKVQKAASHWRRHADAAGVSAKSVKEVAERIRT
jgi:serine/threonine-protein kinase HipA